MHEVVPSDGLAQVRLLRPHHDSRRLVVGSRKSTRGGAAEDGDTYQREQAPRVQLLGEMARRSHCRNPHRSLSALQSVARASWDRLWRRLVAEIDVVELAAGLNSLNRGTRFRRLARTAEADRFRFIRRSTSVYAEWLDQSIKFLPLVRDSAKPRLYGLVSAGELDVVRIVALAPHGSRHDP